MQLILGRMRVRQRLWLNVGLAVTAIALVLFIVLLQSRDSQMTQRRLEMRGLVESAFGIIEHHGKLAEAGTLTADAAKRQAADLIESLHYREAGHFWVTDTGPTMVMHPFKPELNGQDLTHLTDPDGKRIFVSFVETAEAHAEGGIVAYGWPKPGRNSAVPKISYVKLYRPWGWIVGTGAYVDDIEAAFWRQATTLGAVVAVISAVVLLVATVVGRSILTPIGKLQHAVKEVAVHGNLSVRANIVQGGELGAMGRHFDVMLEHIQQFAHEVGNAVNEVASAATELATITEQMQRSVENELSQTTLVATAMTEMSTTVKEIAADAVDTADATREADGQVVRGTNVVNGVTETIGQLADEVRQAGDVISKLAEDSHAIGKVLDVIHGVAEQTNLLALNAAIEAARAGEQGRGFAVVADEVRGLARRTQESTSEIQQMIQTLQERTQAAVSVMKAGQEQAVLSKAREQDAVDSLASIADSVARIKDMSAHIATASEQQSAVAEDVNQSIIKIDAIAAETMTGATEIAMASRSLAELAERVRAVSNQFRG